MGSFSSREDNSNDENEDFIEVYLLMKALGADEDTCDVTISHHICLFKCSDGTFCYTELDVNTKGGPCKLHFGKYNFLRMPVYYKPIGRTRKTLNEIIEWVRQNKTAGTSYTLVFNDCQVYAQQCIQYLDVFDVPPMFTNPVLGSVLFRGGLSGALTEEHMKHTLNIRCASSPNEIRLSSLF